MRTRTKKTFYRILTIILLAAQFEEVSEKLASERQRVHDYEVLIENFRERISEKDTLMDRMKKDYQQRIEQYTKEIEDLQGSYHGGSRKSDRKPL